MLCWIILLSLLAESAAQLGMFKDGLEVAAGAWLSPIKAARGVSSYLEPALVAQSDQPLKDWTVCVVEFLDTMTLDYKIGMSKWRYSFYVQAPIRTAEDNGILIGTTSPSFAPTLKQSNWSTEDSGQVVSWEWMNPEDPRQDDGYTVGNGCVNLRLPFGGLVTFKVHLHGTDEDWLNTLEGAHTLDVAQLRLEDGMYRQLFRSFSFTLKQAPKASWIPGQPYVLLNELTSTRNRYLMVKVYDHYVPAPHVATDPFEVGAHHSNMVSDASPGDYIMTTNVGALMIAAVAMSAFLLIITRMTQSDSNNLSTPML